MIAVDTNILVYAHREDSEWHLEAFRLIRELAESNAVWAIPWPCVHEFLAIVTHPRIFLPPTPVEAAAAQVDAWLESPSVTLLSEAPDYWPGLRHALVSGRISGPQIHDARIVGLCVQHGVSELWSADRDFNRLAGRLTVRNPLVG